ncbi:MAG: prepilin-type N-terminal cleavage/methylation domain-containing protein [Sedimentibacter sp.]|uniref:PilW family protein n=1 Tax=Sedimentibacter sp. TaxID=1960295 RepID=UPI003158A201
MIKNNRGFTLVELMAALGLSAVVISLVIAFFVVNVNNYRKINTEAELQFQSQYILNFMSAKIMKSRNISLVRRDEVVDYSLSVQRTADTEMNTVKISFRFGDSTYDNYVFHIVNGNIRYGLGGRDIKPTVELGSFVKNMFISLLKNDSLGNANALRIRLILEKDGQSYETRQIVYMRNSIQQ